MSGYCTKYGNNRESHGSDSSSAYSGSDTMASIQSEIDPDGPDFNGLAESAVDSDEDDDLVECVEVIIFHFKILFFKNISSKLWAYALSLI